MKSNLSFIKNKSIFSPIYFDTKEFNKPSYNEDKDQLEKKRKEEENGETRTITTRNQVF